MQETLITRILTVILWCLTFNTMILFRHDLSTLITLCCLLYLVMKCIQSIAAIVGTQLSKRLETDPLKEFTNLRRWNDYCWQLVIHIVATCWELYVLHDQEWFQKPETCWIPTPYLQSVKPSLYYLNMFQIGVWINTAFSLRYVDERQKDFTMLFVHHLFTIILVTISHASGFQRIGVLVLILHDASDISLDVLKLVNKLKLEGARYWFQTEIMFCVNLVIWCILRLYLYPTVVLYSTLVSSVATMNPQWNAVSSESLWTYFDRVPDYPYMYPLLNFLLLGLFGMHIWWTYLLLRIAWNLVLAKEDPNAVATRLYDQPSDK